MDPRIQKLAETLINFSVRLQKGENVLIQARNEHGDFVKALVREAYKAGGNPFVWLNKTEIERELAKGYNEDQLKLLAETDAALMRRMDAYIGFTAVDNSSEMGDISGEQMSMYSRIYDEEVHGKIRVPYTKWVVLRYPTPAMAQAASMSMEGFTDFFFDVCTMDYSRMNKAMDPLKELMEKTDKVHIIGPGTDLTFSIKGLPAIKCAGECNIPDGEIYTAPVKDSVNGVITYNTPSIEDGFTFENIRLTFENGRIVKAEANDNARIMQMFDMDEGARYIGEFAIGVNPYITKAMKNTLFDEKIMGSFHFTPGASYDDCYNGNKSALHWDLVCIQTPEYGGGEIWFDDVLIRKDGRFVLPELECLNPENLK